MAYSLSKSSNCDEFGCIYFKVIYRLQYFFLIGMILVARFLMTNASRGPSAIADLLVGRWLSLVGHVSKKNVEFRTLAASNG